MQFKHLESIKEIVLSPAVVRTDAEAIAASSTDDASQVEPVSKQTKTKWSFTYVHKLVYLP